ncbi:MAG: penicillin-binding protein 1C [Chthoniobacterales bacterium]
MRNRGRITAAATSGVVVLLGAIVFSPLPGALTTPAIGSLTLLDSRGGELAEIANADARAQFPCRLDEMGAWLPQVTVALEDHRFFHHHGIDWPAVAAAARRNLRAGRTISGASTITQQFVKLATRREGRNWRSKLSEAVLAWKLERRWSKERILTEYLNRSSYGNRRLGPEAAARAYFNKHAAQLTLGEAIYLAGLPHAPTRLNPWSHSDAAERRFLRSLARLYELGAITTEQRDLLTANPPVVERTVPPHRAPHFVDTIVARQPKQRGTLRTTLDPALQTTAEQLVRAHLQTLNRNDISQAAVVVIENATGAVRALVGSENYDIAQVNGAMQPRSCGSTLKPFMYLSALDRRVLTAATLLPDTPDAIRNDFPDYDPQNFSHHYLGPVRMREALACSLNVPAVYTLKRLGARETFFQLTKWGFNFPRGLDDYGAGFLLGNAETRLVDLAAAYAGLARGGLAIRAKFAASEQPQVVRVASPEACAIVTDILADNEAREKSFGTHSPLSLPQRVAVKTGTSSGFRDTWTVGFDKQHTVGVWAGNLDGRPMRDMLAIRAASPLWAAMMLEMLKRDEPLDAPAATRQLVRRRICTLTGLLPSARTTTTTDEWFIGGTEPAETSAQYFAADGTLVLPEEYAAWCATPDNTSGARVASAARITNPPANARYNVDPALPRKQQMIELRASLPGDVHWFVNDAPQAAQNNGRVFWLLAPGEWKIRAVSATAAAEERISVE